MEDKRNWPLVIRDVNSFNSRCVHLYPYILLRYKCVLLHIIETKEVKSVHTWCGKSP